MAAPIYIAVNQTVSDIELVELRLTVPASGQVNLSNFNPTWRIQSDLELLAAINGNSILLNDGTSTLDKPTSLQYLSPTASKEVLINVQAGADVTAWSNVSTSLGGEAGATAGLVFKSDGAGGGSMGKNTQTITRRITVGLAGDVDYNSIAAALSAADSGGCSASSPWQIEVYPGTYTEAPMNLKPGMTLVAAQQRMDTVFVVASNSAADLFTCTGGYVSGIVASGVTDSAKCLFRCATANSQVTFFGVKIRNCSTGWDVSGGATVFQSICSAVITGPSQGITTFSKVSGSTSYLGVHSNVLSCVSALLPYYSGNPIQTVYWVTDEATLFVLGATYRVAPKDSTADIFFADEGSNVYCISTEIANVGNAFHIGSSGTNTTITVQSTVLTNNTLNVLIESSTGTVFAQVSTDTQRKSIVSGGKLLGTIQYRTDEIERLVGDVRYRFAASDKDVNLEDYFSDFTSTGVCEGGVVTAGTGLHVDVSEGDGWCVRPDPYDDAEWVTWADVTALDLTASSTNYVHYSQTSQSIEVGTSPPGVSDILLATVVTDGSGIRYLHNTRTVVDDPTGRLHQYLLATRKQALKSGCAVTQGTSARKISVGSGSYYLALNPISYAGTGGDATFSYFYGTNGATEVASQTQLSITEYDNAGTLTTMTGGYYRLDTVILTSDGRVNVIYGTAQYSTKALAEAASLGNTPTFMEPSAFPVARVVVQEGVGISAILDARPAYGGSGGAGGVSVHSSLAGLDADDHTQYLLVSGSRSMNGNLGMGSHNITNVGTVDGVTVSAHASRHNPGGADALSTGTPVAISVGASPSAGTGSSYALNDHQHGITAGSPSSIGTANSAGTASSVARSDHVHNHGAQTDGSLHAVATTTVAGFLSAADKLALDTLVLGNTTVPVRNETGSTLLKGRAVTVVGWSTPNNVKLVAYADKDDPNLRPAIGVLQANLSNNTTGTATTQGLIEGIDTSSWSLTDQLVLGNSGLLVRPPPDNTPFTGEVQNIGIVSRVHVSDGHLIIALDGLEVVTGPQVFALTGTSGTPGPTNKYVTNSDARVTADQAAGTASIRTLGTGALQATAGNDSRLSDDRTASGLRTATTVVSVSGATAPTAGQALIATGGSAATWQTLLALTSSAPANVTKATASVGTSGEAARADHKHDITTATAVSVGTANAEGTSTSLSRADHVHSGLTRGASDFSTFAAKTTPVSADVFLLEDSAAGGAKKSITYSNLMSIAAGYFANGGDAATATRSLGNTTAFDLNLITNGVTRLTITAAGNVTASGRLASTTYIMGTGPDLSCIPVVGGQSVITTWWGMQLVGNKQSNVEYTPTNYGAAGDYGIIIPAQQAAATAVMIRGATGQSGNLTQWQNQAGSVLASVDASGNFTGGTYNNVTVAGHASRHQPGGADAIPTATAVSIGTANSAGTSTSLARADHVHNHGAQTDGTLHAAVVAGGTSGFMTGADKTKLDGIASGATATPLASTSPADVTKATAAVGVGSTAARADHKHDVSTAAASSLTVGGASSEGTATSLARSDHTHALPAFGTTAGTFAQGNDSRLSDDRTASGLRSATTVVGVSAATAPTAGQALIATSGTAASWQTLLTSNLPANVTKAAASAGTATDVSRSDHKHDITTATAVSVGTANAEGTATSLARADHVHSGLTRGASDFSAFTLKAAPVAADVILIEDSAAAGAKKYVTAGTLPTTDSNALHKTTSAEISALTEKTTPVDADVVVIEDSAASYAKKKVQLLNLPRGATLAAACATRTTTQAITNTFSNITYDTTVIETDANIIDHLAANLDRIQVKVAGTYLVSYSLNVTPSATERSYTQAVKNGSVVIPGSGTSTQNYTNEDNPHSTTFVVSLAVNDYISIQARVGSGTGTVTIPANITVYKLDGTTGATGSGSTITVQEDGIPVTGTPHSTLNFGSGITTTNAGSGVAQVALDTYPPLGDSTTSPSAPTSGSLLFAKFRAGRRMAAQIGPSGIDYSFQPALFGNKIGLWSAQGNGSSVSTLNFGTSNTGTATTRNVATTSFFTTIRRLGFVSSTTAGSSAGVRHNLAQFFSGNGAGIGGFFFVARFGISQTQTGYRFFVGLSATTGAFGNADPSSLLNLIGIGMDTGDTNIQFMHNDGAGTATKVTLGASWPRPTANTQFYELRLFVAPNTTTFYWSLENLDPANNLIVEGSVTTNIPSNTTLLSPQVWINNAAQAAAVAIDVSSLYIETDN